VSGGVRVIAVATDEEEQAVRERILDGSLGREIAGQFVVKRGTRTIGGGNIANAVIAIPPADGIGWETYGQGGGGGGTSSVPNSVTVKPGDQISPG